MTEAKPILTVIAGPNGSGKSTFTRSINEALQVPVIDPDVLARLIKPDAPEEAAIQGGRQAIQRARAYLANNESFAVETTLSGNTYLRMMALDISRVYWAESEPINLARRPEILQRVRKVKDSQYGHVFGISLLHSGFRLTSG